MVEVTELDDVRLVVRQRRKKTPKEIARNVEYQRELHRQATGSGNVPATGDAREARHREAAAEWAYDD